MAVVGAGCVFCAILLSAALVTSEYRLPEEKFTGRITPDSSKSSNDLAVSTTTYTIVTWLYTIKVHKYHHEAPHPYVFFHDHEQYHVYLRNYGNGMCIEDTDTLLQYDIRDPRLTLLEQTWRSPCVIQSEGTLLCGGKINVAAAYPVNWIASIAYRCPTDRTKPLPLLNISYDVTIEPYENVTCSSTNDALSTISLNSNIRHYLDEFKTYYNECSLWNMFGLTDMDIKEQIDYFPLLEGHKCYKYLFELVFRLALPECVRGRIVYQCSEMCEDFRAACAGSGGVLLEYALGCGNLASKQSEHPCVYKPVTCDVNIETPENGYVVVPGYATVNSEAYFYCNNGYELMGNTTAVCRYSGLWEIHDRPKCRKQQKEPIVVIIVLSVLAGLTLLILAISFYIYGKYRHEVFILVFKYLRCLLCCSRFRKTHEDKLYDGFVAYHDNDESFVRNMQEKLEASGYKLYVEYRDGRLGEPMLRYIPEAIARSQRVLIMLSKPFLEDRMCEYMLDQAFYQTLEGESFKVIIILMQEQKTLDKQIPRFLKGFLRTGASVHVKEQLFCTKIKHAMPCKRNDIISVSAQTDKKEIEKESNCDEIDIQVDI